MKEEIRICSNHQDYEVPLIWTFSFPGSEYWCPYCGSHGGMFGTGKRVPLTDELAQRQINYKTISDDYLHAIGVRVCSGTIWKGEIIRPENLPQAEKDRLNKIVEDWKYEVRI